MPVLEQRKMHCQKNLLNRGMHCIVLFRHYDLLESIWPFQYCSARLLLRADPVNCSEKGPLQRHFSAHRDMLKHSTNSHTLCHVYSCAKHLSQSTWDIPAMAFWHVPPMQKFAVVALGLSASAVIWMGIIPITLASWSDHRILRMWGDQQQDSNSWT